MSGRWTEMIGLALALSFALTFALVSCANSPQSSEVELRDSAGVRIVTHSEDRMRRLEVGDVSHPRITVLGLSGEVDEVVPVKFPEAPPSPSNAMEMRTLHSPER